MAKTPFNFVAYFRAKPGREDDLARILSDMVAPTRAEQGCVNYDLHQHQDDPSRFVLYEGWKSPEALDQHMTLPHFKTMLAALEDVVAERDEQGRPFRSIALTMISERA